MHVRGAWLNFQSNQLWLVEEDIPVRLYYIHYDFKALTAKTGIYVFKTDQTTAAISSSIPDPAMIIS